MRKLLLIMIAMLFCVCIYAGNTTSGSVDVTLDMSAADNKFFHCGFTSDNSLTSVEKDPTPKSNVTLTLAESGIKAINNQSDTTGAGKLYLWWKNSGYKNAKIQLTCLSALTNPSADENARYITWKAISGGVDAFSSSDDSVGEPETVKKFDSAALDFKVQAVDIETVSIPAGATGSYSATLKVGVIDLS